MREAAAAVVERDRWSCIRSRQQRFYCCCCFSVVFLLYHTAIINVGILCWVHFVVVLENNNKVFGITIISQFTFIRLRHHRHSWCYCGGWWSCCCGGCWWCWLWPESRSPGGAALFGGGKLGPSSSCSKKQILVPFSTILDPFSLLPFGASYKPRLMVLVGENTAHFRADA